MFRIFALIALCAHLTTGTDEASNGDIIGLIKSIQKDIAMQETKIGEIHDSMKILTTLVMRQDESIRKNEKVLVKVISHMEKEDASVRSALDDLSQKLQQQDVKTDVREIKRILTAVLPGKTEGTAAESCLWLSTHFYNLKDGHYWTSSHGKAKYSYCRMDEGVTTTTPASTTTMGASTTTKPASTTTTPASTTTKNDDEKSERFTYKPLSKEPGTKHNPGKSCKDLKQKHPSLKSRMYWIKLAQPTRMYCDMETSEGGWTLVGKATVATEAEVTEVGFPDLISDDTSRLSEVTNNRFLLSGTGLRNLQKHIQFSTIRWYCYKPWHGRTLHIYTSNTTLGNKVVDYMLDRISHDNRPSSCGSFDRLGDDSSVIGQHCERWDQQKWDGCGGYDNEKLYCYPMYLNRRNEFNLGSYRTNVNCDDLGNEPNYSAIGEWMFYVK